MTTEERAGCDGADRLKQISTKKALCPVCGEPMAFIYGGFYCEEYYNHLPNRKVVKTS